MNLLHFQANESTRLVSPLKEIKRGCEVSCRGRGGVGVGRGREEEIVSARMEQTTPLDIE